MGKNKKIYVISVCVAGSSGVADYVFRVGRARRMSSRAFLEAITLGI